MDQTGGAAQRIGDPERDAAVEALNVHREQGRLDSTEYEDRQVTVSRARTWADIQPVFADLPQPHPAMMPSQGQPPARSGGGADVVEPGITADAEPGGLLGDVIAERYRSTVMALTPFAALLLYFGTRTWVWFLAIPIMAVLLYGPGGGKEDRRDRHRRRDR